MHVMVRRHNARHWIYPTEVPERAYQLAMIKTALLHNTLVCVEHCFDTADGKADTSFATCGVPLSQAPIDGNTLNSIMVLYFYRWRCPLGWGRRSSLPSSCTTSLGGSPRLVG